MDRWIASIPKPLFALIVIIVGFVVIVLNDPPRTVCDAQLDALNDTQREFLYSRSGAGRTTKAPLVVELYDLCESNNSPGGCFELFQRLKKLELDLANVSVNCADELEKDSQIKGWLLKNLKLMVRIGWGDQPPAPNGKRPSWFDASDLALFCDMKKTALRLLQEEKFDEWRDGVVTALPGADHLEIDQARGRSLFATPCEFYR